MIIGFRSKTTQDIYDGGSSREARKIPENVWKATRRKLDMLEVAQTLADLRIPPANRLEVLRGSLKGRYSIRINDQYRVVFGFYGGNAYHVEITDYH